MNCALFFILFLVGNFTVAFRRPGEEKNWAHTRASKHNPCIVNKASVLFPTNNEILLSLIGTFTSHIECKLNRPQKFSDTKLHKVL